MTDSIHGCPRHPTFNRDCIDIRCQRRWKVEGAPTADEQIRMWVDGKPVCPNRDHECCPDFSCCNHGKLWPEEKRKRFAAATQGEREKMLMGSLVDLLEDAGEKAYVTRGDPTDHK